MSNTPVDIFTLMPSNIDKRQADTKSNYGHLSKSAEDAGRALFVFEVGNVVEGLKATKPEKSKIFEGEEWINSAVLQLRRIHAKNQFAQVDGPSFMKQMNAMGEACGDTSNAKTLICIGLSVAIQRLIQSGNLQDSSQRAKPSKRKGYSGQMDPERLDHQVHRSYGYSNQQPDRFRGNHAKTQWARSSH
jgi:hypothetical protein